MVSCGGVVEAVFGSGCREGAAGSSIATSGRIGFPAGAEVPSASRSITDSVARIGGGVDVRGGEAAFLSGESGSAADSRRGELMEEYVFVESSRCTKEVKNGYPDKYNSDDKERR